MYLPESFQENRIDVLHELIRNHPFGSMVTMNERGLDANHIPFEIDSGVKPLGILRGHVARANPVWRELSGNAQGLAIFQGADAYISPSWYPTKSQTGMVVPTWNYAVVHAHGVLRAIDDPKWLRALIERLTETHESGRSQPWKVSDAPPEFVEKLLGAIVGIEMIITKLAGKWKTSQNRSVQDRAGVVRGLTAQGDESSLAMAKLVGDVSDENCRQGD
jgi:transcriptional regulator